MGRAAATGEDGLRIALVQPKSSLDGPAASSITAATSTSGSTGPVSDPCKTPPSLSTVNSPDAAVSSATHPAAHPDSEEQVAAVSVFVVPPDTSQALSTVEGRARLLQLAQDLGPRDARPSSPSLAIVASGYGDTLTHG
jgi:hypothetical protein